MNLIVTWLAITLVWAHPSSAKVVPEIDPMEQYDDMFDFDPIEDAPKEKYAVMFDAGSSGTRVKVYKYVKSGKYLQVSDLIHVDVPKPNKVKPGLSTFAHDTSGIKEYLKPLLAGAHKVVPDDVEASTPLRIFATAGMRLLEKDEIRAIIDEVDALLTDKNLNKFQYKKGNTHVITGEDEAVYDWVTVNFLKGAFSGKSNGKTYGALDMGGASHQNAFQTRRKIPTRELDIAGEKYDVFAHSYLGGGGDEALDTYLEKLVKVYLTRRKRVGGTVVYSPCHNYGFLRSVAVDKTTYEIRGAYHPACQRFLHKIFFCKTCEYKNQPELVGDFYGFSVFSYTLKGTGVVSSNGQRVTMKMIDSGIPPFCSKREDQLDFKVDSYAARRCFQLNYIRALLKFGYRVNPRRFKLFSAGSLNGFELNWAVGAVLINNDLL